MSPEEIAAVKVLLLSEAFGEWFDNEEMDIPSNMYLTLCALQAKWMEETE